MFRNFTIAVAAFYVATVLLLIVGLYYVVVVAGYANFAVIVPSALGLTLLAGFAISKIAIDPMKKHFEHLEHFSKETLHELNLPISTITANLQMLKRSHGDEKSVRRMQRIESACTMLKERYDELDYLIKKQMQLEQRETFDVSELVKERLALLRTLYSKMRFEAELKPLNVTLDRMGLKKVIDNLVDNAVKYSGGSEEIRLRVDGTSLSVTDFGVGMDEVELLGIFERYYQNDSSMPGFGIGLGLVSNYCDRNGIKLRVDSKKGEGTTMTLEFKQGEAHG